ncbi:MAG: PmoA family protein, partial [Sedimentisphaerales bacterium]|nr:PmoA family protein [Sedimentisphaerales bacterium]
MLFAKGKGVACLHTALLLLILLMLARCSKESSIGQLTVIEKDGGFEVAQGYEKVLFYQSQSISLNGKYIRSHYIHPLYGLDGEILTENYPWDHLHHRGIFWAWHQLLVNGKSVGDSWILENFSNDVQNVNILKDDSQSLALQIEVLWKSPLWLDSTGEQKPFVKEITTIRIHNAADGIRIIDFQINLLALEDNVHIGGSDNKTGYSGFSTRIKMPDGLVFTSTKGNVVPEEHSMQIGPWVDFAATFQNGDSVSGLAVLSHSSIPDYPNNWVLRQKESMQNAAFPSSKTFKLPSNKPLT